MTSTDTNTRNAQPHRFRRAIAAGAALVAIGVAVPTANAWTSNNFQSPTGNIRCRYDVNSEVKACLTGNDGQFAALGRWGRACTGRGGTFLGGPVLRYGRSFFVSHKFRCNSKISGMMCASVQSGHGFFTSRDTWRGW